MENINEILNLKNINVLNFKYFNDRIEIDIELQKKYKYVPSVIKKLVGYKVIEFKK